MNIIKSSKMKESRMRDNNDIGIITFHCADNYGAMLQAFALKSFLCRNGRKAEIILYEPPFLTGRHWWIPYIPDSSFLKCLRNARWGWECHLQMRKDFFRLRYNMKKFRKIYLNPNSQRKSFFACQLRKLSYQYYIVGSDQIWNPEITFGLQRVYFGDFKNKLKKKVISYGASLGGDSLDEKYNEKISKLLCNLDAISVREETAIPYIKKFYMRSVIAVLDPVFLLKKEEWENIEKLPKREEYILVYVTEFNEKLVDYAKKLSDIKGIQVIELRTCIGKTSDEFMIEYTAGPSEFLGYIHKAAYVVTNSFHGVAFSIIYQKKFIAFPHSSRNTRICNLLRKYGLENLQQNNPDQKMIDSLIDWDDIKKRTEEHVKISAEYLWQEIILDSCKKK